MSRTRVKFCGITRVEGALDAAALGVDAIGLVFAPGSPRTISTDMAATIAASVPPFVARVGLFRDATAEEVRAVCRAVPLELLQFHGSEPPDYCRAFGRPYLKAIGMDGDADLELASRDYADAAALLLDAHAPGAAGGTGRAFDWRRAREARTRIVLAGGLTPENVALAIAAAAPYAVDVSSGIESSPGLKDSGKMRRFLDEVRRAG